MNWENGYCYMFLKICTGELRRRLMSTVQTVQRYTCAPSAAAPIPPTCFPFPPPRFVATTPSLLAFYSELLHRRRALSTLAASVAGQPSVAVPLSFIPASSSSFSRHHQFDSEDDTTRVMESSSPSSSSSGAWRKSLSVDTNRYNPYDRAA